MDWEAPADAWYVFLAVSIVSVALAGVVLSLPTGPAPDANGAANTIETVSAGSVDVSGSYEHDADAVKIHGDTIAMTNDHGTSRATVAYGSVVAVNGVDRLENLTYGEPFESAFESEIDDPFTDAGAEFLELVDRAAARNEDEWTVSDGELHATIVTVEPERENSVRAGVETSHEAYDETTIEIPTGIFLEHEGDATGFWDWRVDYEKEVWENDEFDDSDSLSDFIESAACDWLGIGCDDREDPVPSTHAEGSVYFGSSTGLAHETFEENMEPAAANTWVGEYGSDDPLEIEVIYDDGDHRLACSGELTPATETNFVELCPGTASPGEFDGAHWLETDDEEDEFYVTIVTV